MICNCCVELLKIKLRQSGIEYARIGMGEIALRKELSTDELEKFKNILYSIDLALIEDKDEEILEITKQAVHDLIHKMNNVETIIKKSEYLVEKTGVSYQRLSKIFSAKTGITIERYIILNKIERIKSLIETDEFTMSEIAYMMEYSSVHYLSSQFKKETGYTPSDFKKLEIKPKIDFGGLSRF